MSKSWPMVALREVLRKSEESVPIDPNATYREVTIKLWGKGVVLRREASGSEIAAPRRSVVCAGQFILSRIDARNGAFGIVPPALDGAVVSNDFPTFNLNIQRIIPKYLGWLSRTENFIDLCKSASEGTTNRVRLKEEKFLGTSIALPSLEEQQRIVAQIEELAAKIEDARGLRRQAVEKAEALCRAGSSLAFRGEWAVACLENICSLITDGTHQTPRYVDDGYTFLSAQNVKPFRFMPEIYRKVSYEDYIGCQKRVKPQKGDVLLTRVGAGIGEAAVLDRDIDFAFYVSLALIRPISEKVTPEFLVHWLNSPDGLKQSRGQTLGRGHSQGNLNLKLLRKFSLPLPSLLEQRRIVDHLDNLQTAVNSLKRLQSDTATELDAMLPSILDKAFKGAL